jgi:hypothetical protein
VHVERDKIATHQQYDDQQLTLAEGCRAPPRDGLHAGDVDQRVAAPGAATCPPRLANSSACRRIYADNPALNDTFAHVRLPPTGSDHTSLGYTATGWASAGTGAVASLAAADGRKPLRIRYRARQISQANTGTAAMAAHAEICS